MVGISWEIYFSALIRRPGDLMKNLETPGKTGRVGRYESVWWQKKSFLSFTALITVIPIDTTCICPIFLQNEIRDSLTFEVLNILGKILIFALFEKYKFMELKQLS